MEIVTAPSRKKRWTRRKILTLLILLVIAAAAAVVGISVYVGLSLTQQPRKSITEVPSQYGLAYQDISFMSRDGKTKLEGWVIEGENPKLTVMMSHGYGGNRIEQNVGFLTLAQQFHRQGYRVVMFDFRASGTSEGKTITIGSKERLDLLGAADWVESSYGGKIALYGVSMGASTSILAAGEDSAVVGIIADSPFSDLRSYLSKSLPVWTKLPNIPFTPVIMNLVPRITDVNLDEASPIRVMKKLTIPVLFIHGKADTSVPYAESEKLHAVRPDTTELWLVDGADHVHSYREEPEQYVEKILSFLQKLP